MRVAGQKSGWGRCLLGRIAWRDRRAVVALEFAILSLPFLIFLLGIFEISFDLYTQSVMDASLQRSIRLVETGNAQNSLSANDFITKYFCPIVAGQLGCTPQNVLVSLQKVTLDSTNDFYAFTTGSLPLAGRSLSLPASYGSFCNPAANQAIVVSVIYLGPTFIGNLLPITNLSVYYNNKLVHATLSTKGFINENFPTQVPAAGTKPAASC